MAQNGQHHSSDFMAVIDTENVVLSQAESVTCSSQFNTARVLANAKQANLPLLQLGQHWVTPLHNTDSVLYTVAQRARNIPTKYPFKEIVQQNKLNIPHNKIIPYIMRH